MRSIVTFIVLLSMFVSVPTATAANIFDALLGIGMLLHQSNQQLKVIRLLNEPLMEQLKLQGEIQKQQVAAQTYIMALNANDRQQLLTTINQKLVSGQSFKVEELEAIRIVRGMLAVSVSQPVGSVTVGRGAEFGGFGGVGYPGGGFEDQPYYGGGGHYDGGYSQARFNAQAAANDAAWAARTGQQR